MEPSHQNRLWDAWKTVKGKCTSNHWLNNKRKTRGLDLESQMKRLEIPHSI